MITETYKRLKDRLRGVVPDFELRHKAGLADEILRLKAERNAVVLAHNYMEPALFHSIPDYAGDSLFLCRQAARTAADVIVFCGVKFMAETAKILNPDKTVLLPAREAGCSLATSVTATDVRRLRRRYPGAPIVAYVNTYAEVKAEADICCTSGNAAAVVRSLEAERIVFVPDGYLAANVARETGRSLVPADLSGADRPAAPPADGAEIVAWSGHCEVHEKFTVADVEAVRKQFPEAIVLAHPECRPEVIVAADHSGSTAAMSRFVEEAPDSPILLLTECAMADNVAAANPGKELLRLCSVRCPHMNEITLEGTRKALIENRYEVEVAEPIRSRAKRSLERMIAVG